MIATKILEGNKLIAEFMGYKKTSEDKDFTFYEHPDKKGIIIQSEYNFKKFTTHELMEARGFIFNRSWNWLMPVIDKIEGLFPIVKTQSYCQGIFYDFCIEIPKQLKLLDGRTFRISGETKIESVWLVVIEFIKWYNSNVIKPE